MERGESVQHTERDRKGFPNRTHTCVDGDPLCDTDGSANGTCTFRVGLCLNNDDSRLLKKGVAACAASDVATWEVKKPRPTSGHPEEAANALALRGAVAALGPSTIGGSDQQLVTFTPPLSAGELCTAFVDLAVPIGTASGGKGRASIGARATTTPPLGMTRGTRDTDKLKLACLPPP